MKPRKPYYTYYPWPAWYWFDDAVYKQFAPRGVGNLPTPIFKQLKGGTTDHAASRYYDSEAAAMADLQATIDHQ